MTRWLVLTAALLSTTALAQETPRQKAKAFFVEGRTHYASGAFAKALDAFRQANALAPHPLMLFNIAQVYEAMDDLPEAIANYEQYLATGPADAAAVGARVGQLRATLESWPAVEVQTTPAGAAVRVGKAENPARGTTPVTLRLPPRAHPLFLSLAGHEDVERSVTLKAGDRTSMAVAMVPIKPIVRVVTTPIGARVSIDGASGAGVTPLDRAVDGGARTVRVELVGFEPIERKVTLDASHTREAPYVLELTLEKARPRGELVLTVEPPGSEVLIDGELVGRAPLPGPLRLVAAMHEIEVRGPSGEVHKEMVSIEADSTARADIDLGGGIDAQTIGWIGMGVGTLAIAGGAVAGALALGSSGDLEACRDDADCIRTQEEASLADDVRSQALMADVFIWSGVALAAGGAVLYLLSSDGQTSVEGQAEPSVFVAPIDGGAAAVGRFAF